MPFTGGRNPVDVSGRTIERLSLYRRILGDLARQGAEHVFSHQLAALAGSTPAQVRRDMMALGSQGSPTRGYDTRELINAIGDFLDSPAGQGVFLAGVGNLGRAILAYFGGRRPNLSIVAAFDSDPSKTDRMILGCQCYPIEELSAVARKLRPSVGVVTVPAAHAQAVADEMVATGITGILNFAPIALRVPPTVYVEQVDVTTFLEKVAYFARMTPIRKGEATA